MSQQYLVHITREGERWDSIAHKYYGDVTKMGLLIETNSHVPITPSIPSGFKMYIPMIEQASATQGLPPWK